MPPTMLAGSVLLAESTIHDEAKPLPYHDVKPMNRKKNLAEPVPVDNKNKQPEYKLQIVWRNVIFFMYAHLAAIYGFYLMFASAKLVTILFAIAMAYIGGLGITGGAHRLWAHNCYKAKWPARLFLVVAQTIAFQNSVYEWVRDHRVHHKYTDTNADPHNASRGFFFSHMGWLCCRKHNDVKEKGLNIDMSDLEADPLVMFQHRHYFKLMILSTFVVPTLIPYLFLGESFSNSYYIAGVMKWIIGVHFTWLVNSYAHVTGTLRPYDKNIGPSECMIVSYLTNGEGFHNYHHTFPWDYKAAELGSYKANGTTAVIDLFAKIGWTYDLKSVDHDLIKRRVLRTGDGTHIYSKEAAAQNQTTTDKEPQHDHSDAIWGWDDPDMNERDKKCVKYFNKRG